MPLSKAGRMKDVRDDDEDGYVNGDGNNGGDYGVHDELVSNWIFLLYQPHSGISGRGHAAAVAAAADDDV